MIDCRMDGPNRHRSKRRIPQLFSRLILVIVLPTFLGSCTYAASAEESRWLQDVTAGISIVLFFLIASAASGISAMLREVTTFMKHTTDEHYSRIERGVEAICERLREVEGHLINIEYTMDVHGKKLDDPSGQLDQIASAIDSLDEKIKEVMNQLVDIVPSTDPFDD